MRIDKTTYLSENLLIINNKEAPKGDAVVTQHTVCLSDLHTLVGQQGDMQLPQPSSFARGVHPAVNMIPRLALQVT